MKKLYSGLAVISMVLLSNSAFSQEKITTEQIQPVLDKLDVLGKQNPAGAFPLDKLTKEEYGLYKAYKTQDKNTKTYPYGIMEQDLKVKVAKAEVQPILDKIDNLGDSPLAFPDHLFTPQELKLLRIYELQNLKPQKPGSNKVFTKAYALDGRTAPRPFGTLPLTPPITMTQTGSIGLPRAIYADDIAGNGNMYALDNASRNLVTINNSGVVTDIGPVTNIAATSTLSGLSWNSVTSTMYAVALPNPSAPAQLCTVNLTTGVATVVASITGMVTPIWLEIDNAGLAYSIDITTDNLYSIDLVTGASTLIGPLGVNCQFAQDADFNRDTNQLYMASYTGGGVGGIYTINTTTGAATLVGDTTPNNAEYAVFSIADSLEPPVAINNAFYKNSYPIFPLDFGTLPLAPPNTLTPINLQTASLFADDLAGDGNLYALDNVSRKLVKVFSDGTAQDVGPLTGAPVGQTVTGLSWNRADNKMYATVGSTLFTVNLTTGALTTVGSMAPMTLPIWLEIDNAGLAYSADIITDKLYSVNLLTGAASEIGPLGINISYAQEADFNTSNNKLYMAGFLDTLQSNLYTVDTTTGAATLVGPTNDNEITMFTIADTLPALAVDNINATKFSYYPNPTTGILNLTASNKIESIEVINVAGQKVMSFAPKSDKSEINLSNLPKGLYFVKATVNGKVITNKVIKK